MAPSLHAKEAVPEGNVMLQGPALENGPGAVGKYRVIAKLGEGGMAHVFLAVAHGPVGFSKLSVLKVVRPHLAEDPDILRMFLDEARLAGRLNHANVVQTYEVGEEGGRYVLVMEYLEGQPLRALQKRMHQKGSTIPLPLQLKILIDALSGLHYAHDLRDFDGTPLDLVHRDISPHNIFVTYDGQVKVLDFGIAKAATSSLETKSGVIKGKVSYMAPEQFRLEPVDRRADIYSMGAILWQVAAGYRLWKGANDAQVLYAVTHGEIPRPSDVKSGVPAELERICMRALAPDPSSRYATAADMQHDLRMFAAELSTAVSALELGAFVAKEFAKERRELRDRIEQQLSRGPEASVPLVNLQNPLLTTGSSIPQWGSNGSGSQPSLSGQFRPHDGTGGSGSIPGLPVERTPSTGSAPIPGTDLTPTPGSVVPSPPDSSQSQFLAVSDSDQQRRGAKGLIIAAVALALLFVGILGAVALHLLASKRSEATESAATGTPSATIVEPPRTVAAPVREAPDANAEPIEIEVSASPEHAKVYLDDEPIEGNPAKRKLPKDGAAHKIRIEAPGYVTRTMDVTADRSARYEFELKRDHSGGNRPPPDKTVKVDTTAPVKTSPPPVKTSNDDGLKTDNIDPWSK